MQVGPRPGDFVRVRSRRWLVEDGAAIKGLNTVSLACVDDDAQGETVSVIWDAELDATILADEGGANVSRLGTDDPSVFAAYLRTLRRNTATAADRNLFQAPFRAGIQQDNYQLLPLRKALRLPRVNLLIADDAGAGKTVEASLVLRELLLRRRVDFVLVAAPAGMIRQWQDELETKFGLAFTIVDREYLTSLRKDRGYGANPWASGSRFLISHSLMSDETYVAGLRELLGNFRPRSMLILDETRHAAPASGSRYAIDSQFTVAIRDLAGRFEPSTGYSFPPRPTTGIQIHSPPCWKFSIRSASPPASPSSRATSTRFWCAASSPTAAISARNSPNARSNQSCPTPQKRPWALPLVLRARPPHDRVGLPQNPNRTLVECRQLIRTSPGVVSMRAILHHRTCHPSISKSAFALVH